MRDVYTAYEYSDLAAHPAFVLMPYQISFMLFFELYRMNIPMFAPSPELLAKWHVKLNVLGERTWVSALYQTPGRGSNIQRHPESTSLLSSDPNNDIDYDSVLEWINLADFYQFPHVTTFSSFEHLMTLLKTADLKKISSDMDIYNVQQKKYISTKWANILHKLGGNQNSYLPSFAHPGIRSEHRDFDTALEEEYGAKLSEECVGSMDSHRTFSPFSADNGKTTKGILSSNSNSVTSTTSAFSYYLNYGNLYFLFVVALTVLIYLTRCSL
jgi:hypothetical protein